MRLTLTIAVLLVASLTAQSPPSFEVASVKPSPASAEGGGTDLGGERLSASNMTLVELVRTAYGDPGRWIPQAQLVGGPDWTRASRFDIQASAGEGNVAPALKLQMLRTLLAERFGLMLHHESRDGAIYLLTVAKPGRLESQLKQALADCSVPAQNRNRECAFRLSMGPTLTILAKGQPMGQLANAFARLLNRSVIDRTELSGGFDAELTFNASGLDGLATSINASRDNASSDAPSIFTAVQEQLGLKLEPAKGPVDVLVIDAVHLPIPD